MTAKRTALQRLVYDLKSCLPARFNGKEDRRRSDRIRSWSFIIAVVACIGAIAKCGTATATAYIVYQETHK